jgi:hypothetical protein
MEMLQEKNEGGRASLSYVPPKERKVDPTEAPLGYRAVAKADINISKVANFCAHCDWRPNCSENGQYVNCADADTPRSAAFKPRTDGCSVVFKRLLYNGTVCV